MIPLIWTNKGNLPIADLEYKVDWFETNDEIGMSEEYSHEGEVVRRSVHVRKKQGSAVGAEQVTFI